MRRNVYYSKSKNLGTLVKYFGFNIANLGIKKSYSIPNLLLSLLDKIDAFDVSEPLDVIVDITPIGKASLGSLFIQIKLPNIIITF